MGPYAANVTKVTWTKGQCKAMLTLGGKAVLGEGCRASCDSSRDACFLGRILFYAKKAATMAVCYETLAADK